MTRKKQITTLKLTFAELKFILFYLNSIGTADWHFLRKFSFTSSQAYFSFKKAFPLFKENESWQKVAKYLWGENGWEEALGIRQTPNEEGNNDDTSSIAPPEEENIPSIESFIFNYVIDEDHAIPEFTNAISFLKPLIENDEKISEDRATVLINTLDEDCSNAIMDILYQRLPESKRKKSPSSLPSMQKELKKFLQFSNSRREYMFYKTDLLREMVSDRKVRIQGSKTIDKMIEGLATYQDAGSGAAGNDEQQLSTPTNDAIRAILERSFLPHQKGAAREACSMGHALEKPILEKWVAEVSKRGYPLRNLAVKGAYTAGLVAKKDYPWAKDSIDFILLTNYQGFDDIWRVEVKARVNARTAAQEQEFLSSTNREKNVSIFASDVHKMISDVGERFQILHHAYVYDLDKVVFMVGDSQSEILQSTVVDFLDEELKMHYGQVLEDLKELALSWMYDEDIASNLPIEIPQNVMDIALTLRQIKDSEAIEGNVNLWLFLINQPLPMPSFKRFIPAICAYWNAVKSGSDTSTKLMDARILFPPHINGETIASSRCILLAFVLIHRLIQTITAKDDLSSYPSLAHYRDAASHRSTYFTTLLTINTFLKSKLSSIGNQNTNQNNENSSSHQQTATTQARNMPHRRRILGVVPQPVDYGVKLPFKTPKKLKTMVEKKKVSTPVCKMYENCTGRLLQVVDITKKQRCTVCKKTTSYYCAGCKSWFCFANRITKKDPKDGIKLVHHQVKGEREIFFSSCYAEKHETTWVAEDQKTSATIQQP